MTTETPSPILDLKAALKHAEGLSREAGVLLQEVRGKGATPDLKGKTALKDAIELVTEYDRACEKLIVSGIKARYPDHAIRGEEGIDNDAGAEGRYCWHVDPIDGTVNFARGMHTFCVSIGLADPMGQPVLGCIYAPTVDECFTAYAGGGARLNGRRIKVSKTRDLAESVILSEFGHDKWTRNQNNVEEWAAFARRVRSLHCLGSTALNLCYVAAGRVDGFWLQSAKSWDVMAGLCLVQEAGGRVSNYRGLMEGVVDAQNLVASNGRIHERMLTVLLMGDLAPRPKLNNI